MGSEFIYLDQVVAMLLGEKYLSSKPDDGGGLHLSRKFNDLLLTMDDLRQKVAASEIDLHEAFKIAVGTQEVLGIPLLTAFDGKKLDAQKHVEQIFEEIHQANYRPTPFKKEDSLDARGRAVHAYAVEVRKQIDVIQARLELRDPAPF